MEALLVIGIVIGSIILYLIPGLFEAGYRGRERHAYEVRDNLGYAPKNLPMEERRVIASQHLSSFNKDQIIFAWWVGLFFWPLTFSGRYIARTFTRVNAKALVSVDSTVQDRKIVHAANEAKTREEYIATLEKELGVGEFSPDKMAERAAADAKESAAYWKEYDKKRPASSASKYKP